MSWHLAVVTRLTVFFFKNRLRSILWKRILTKTSSAFGHHLWWLICSSTTVEKRCRTHPVIVCVHLWVSEWVHESVNEGNFTQIWSLDVLEFAVVAQGYWPLGKRLRCRPRQSDQFCSRGIFQDFEHAGVNQPFGQGWRKSWFFSKTSI